MENTQIAAIFDEIADLLDLQGANPFRIRSYRAAALAIREAPEQLKMMVAAGRDPSELPNIGASTAEKIREILDRGTCRRFEELRAELPEGLSRLMRVPNLGPRKVMQLHRELGIRSIEELRAACEHQEVRKLPGMGARSEKKILEGISTVQKTFGRVLLNEASAQLTALAAHLDKLRGVQEWAAAGSFRRGRETIGDLDILVRADDREQAADRIMEAAAISGVVSRGAEGLSVRLHGGLQVDFRFFDAPSFGSALLYFTGSKAHNLKLRRRAQDKGWKLSEYGLFVGKRRLAGRTEESVYHRLGLTFIPPELREDRGEIEAAEDGGMPDLIALKDVRGDLQCHTTASDGKNTIAEMAQAARARGWQYLAITDHTKRVTMVKGLDDAAARRHADAIRKIGAAMKGFWLMAGIEVDILRNGELDLAEKTLAEMDWVVASIHYDRNLGREQMTDRIVAAAKSGVVNCIGHPLGRIIGRREPLQIDLDRVIEACRESGVRLEINGQPDRLDLPDHLCRRCAEAGVGFTLATDAHSVQSFDFMRYGVISARRGWLTKKDVLNTRTAAQLRRELLRK